MLCRFIFLRSMIFIARKSATFYRLRLRFEYYTLAKTKTWYLLLTPMYDIFMDR